MSGTSNKVMTNRKTAGTVYIQYGLKLFHSKSVVVVNEITEAATYPAMKMTGKSQ